MKHHAPCAGLQWVRFVTGDRVKPSHFPVFERPVRFWNGFELGSIGFVSSRA
ncbi:MAG: hypothetical protein QOF78_1036 [Phycisphaerales bacterium]|nr:hypothetical protein [Phycisphaerales bacterium]